MITINNYFEQIKRIDLGKLEPKFQQVHDLIVEATNNGSSWEEYHESEPTRNLIDNYLRELNDLHPPKSDKKEAAPKNKPAATPRAAAYPIEDARKAQRVEPDHQTKSAQAKPEKGNVTKSGASKKENEHKPTKSVMRVSKSYGDPVERISEELRFVKRFVNLDEKHKFPKHILNFINSLQRAMAEKRIRKTSTYANEILEIQDLLISMYHKHMHQPDKEFKITIEKSILGKLASLVGQQVIMPSVRFIKRFISLQGKLVTNERAKALHNAIAKAINNGTVTNKDPYSESLHDIADQIKVFVQKNPDKGYMVIPSRTLNGLNNILCEGDPFTQYKNERGYDEVPRNTVINSMDLDKLVFETYEFTGKWHEFMGSPERGFSMMVSSHPKYGKSTLCIEFAHYLASNHGRVLYIANEEGIRETIRQKFDRLKAKHPNLSLVDELDEKEISKYEFVFLDSVSRMKLKPEQLIHLQEKYPNISFIYVFQVTKSGVFRGSKSFEHDVDMVVVFPKAGHAKQYGRFNQGGEMTLFKQNLN